MARRFNGKYYLSEGFHSIFTHGFMSFAAVCMIVACLLIMGSFTLLAVNLDHMLGDLEDENLFLAYIDDSYSEEQARALQPKIEAVPNVSQVTFVTRAEALEDFKAGREQNDLMDSLPPRGAPGSVRDPCQGYRADGGHRVSGGGCPGSGPYPGGH